MAFLEEASTRGGAPPPHENTSFFSENKSYSHNQGILVSGYLCKITVALVLFHFLSHKKNRDLKLHMKEIKPIQLPASVHSLTYSLSHLYVYCSCITFEDCPWVLGFVFTIMRAWHSAWTLEGRRLQIWSKNSATYNINLEKLQFSNTKEVMVKYKYTICPSPLPTSLSILK